MRIADIRVENRQRTTHDESELRELAASIKRNGLLHPIIVDKSGRLLAGERRLRAHQLLGLEEISVTIWDDLPDEERAIIELEENVKRADISWQDKALAIERLHRAYEQTQPDWNANQTAQSLSVTPAYISQQLKVARELRDRPEVGKEVSAKAVYNHTVRRETRDIDAAIADKLLPIGAINGPVLPFEVHCVDFLEWAPTYKGRPFDVLHCDFPYGLSMHEAPMQSSRQSDRYDDRPELFFELLGTLLSCRGRLLAPAGHAIFWTSPKFKSAAAAQFRSEPGFVVDDFPLIWHKEDLVGIIPDPRRGPRRTYEMALFVTWGDRFIVKSVSNSISRPRGSASSEHFSSKPFSVVSHFLSMLVDENTHLLDPTCGSGTAVAAGVSLKARRVVGLDIKQEYVDLTHYTIKRRMATDSIIEEI